MEPLANVALVMNLLALSLVAGAVVVKHVDQHVHGARVILCQCSWIGMLNRAGVEAGQILVSLDPVLRPALGHADLRHLPRRNGYV